MVEENRSEGVEFVCEDDGSITARDRETGLARGGQTRSEALAKLAEVLALGEGEGEPIENPDAFLRALDIDPDESTDDEDLVDFFYAQTDRDAKLESELAKLRQHLVDDGDDEQNEKPRISTVHGVP